MREVQKLYDVDVIDEGISDEALDELSGGLEPGEEADAIRMSMTRGGISLLSATDTSSKLVNYTQLSPNCSVRSGKISKITIHHMAGNLTVERCGSEFAKTSRQASSNYGIGTDGRIGCYVEEQNAAWTSSSAWNDNRAITIEVIGVTSLERISVNADHLVALTILLFKLSAIITYYLSFSIVPPQLNPTPKPQIITFIPDLVMPFFKHSFKPIMTVEETVLPTCSKSI